MSDEAFSTPCSAKQSDGANVRLEPGGWLYARNLGPVHGQVQVRIDSLVGPAEYLVCRPWFDPGKPEAGLQIVHRIPARVWAREGDAVRLTLVAAGQPIARPIEWRRSTLAGEVAVLMATRELADCLAALDLARQADIWAGLPPGLQAQIGELAAEHGLADLVPASPICAQHSVTLPPLSVAARQTEAFDAARSAEPSAEPIQVLVSVLGRERADPHFLLSVAGDFCLSGQILALVDLAITKRIRFPRPVPNNDWLNSTLLPFLLLSGDETELPRALWFLAEARKGWLVTPVLGWFGAHLADHATALRTAPELIRAWMRIVEAQARDPWGRAPCRTLIASSQRLMEARKGLPSDLADEIANFALRTHGLSPTFWNAITACKDLPEHLATGRQAFAALEREVLQEGDPASRLEAAREGLEWLRSAGVHGTESFRWECPRLAQPDPGDEGEALLRAFAAPGAQAVTSARRGALQLAIAASREPVARPIDGTTDLRAACEMARNRLHAQGEAEMFVDALQGLTQRRAGLVLALSTLADLIESAQDHRADALVEQVTHLAVTPQGESGALPDIQPILARLMHALSASPRLKAKLEPVLVQLQHAEKGFEGTVASTAEGPEPPGGMMRQRSRALFDTLVMVRSSRARQDSKGPTACARWLPLLSDMGVANVIVVGGHDTALRSDVLEVAVGDGVDTAVHRTLAMLSWAADAGFGHVWLVEDDTLLDPAGVFDSYVWRLCDFYGHRQSPPPGFRHPALGADQIDLSPEGRIFADGGLGYAVSHRALLVLRAVAASAKGARIAAGSNNADKAVADLLALGGIHPEGGGHTGALLRPRGPGGLAVPQGEAQGFMPGWASGDHAGYPGHFDERVLAPARLWPATIPARAAPAGRSLTLVAGRERLDAARDAPVAVICTLRNERFMLGHFLDHYRRMGVTSFIIADNGSDDGSAEMLAEQPDTVVFSAEAPFREAVQGTEWKIALMAQLRPNKWSLVADTDELLVGRELRGPGHSLGWRGGEDLPQFLSRPQWRDHDSFRIRMLDLYPAGPLANATLAGNDPFSEANLADWAPFRTCWLDLGPFSDRRALRSALRHRLIPQSPPEMYVSEKVALVRYRPWMRFSVSMHYAAEVRIAPQELIFGHFKYTADFEQKVRREVRRGQYFNDAAEYRKYAEMNAGLAAGIADPGLSCLWRDAVSDVLADH